MKAVKYLALVAVALAMPLTFTSCGDDDDDDDYYYGGDDPMELYNTVWRVSGCNDNEYNFNGADFHFDVGSGYIDGLEFGNWNWSSSKFSFEEGDDGYLRIKFDSNDKIEGYLSFDHSGNYAEFDYRWTDEGESFHMNLTCIAE